MTVFQNLDRGAWGQKGREENRLRGAWEGGGERAFMLGASSELHFQLMWTVGGSCPQGSVGRSGPGRAGSLLLPLTQSRDSMVKETEVD